MPIKSGRGVKDVRKNQAMTLNVGSGILRMNSFK